MCDQPLWWEHPLPKAQQRAFLTLCLVAWTEPICSEGPVGYEAGIVGQANPQKLGEHRKFTTSAGEKNPDQRELRHWGAASRGVWPGAEWQGLLGRCAGWVLNLHKNSGTFYNIIACFIDIHSKAVYNTIVRHIFGEIWYVVKKCSKTEVYKNN